MDGHLSDKIRYKDSTKLRINSSNLDNFVCYFRCYVIDINLNAQQNNVIIQQECWQLLLQVRYCYLYLIVVSDITLLLRIQYRDQKFAIPYILKSPYFLQQFYLNSFKSLLFFGLWLPKNFIFMKYSCTDQMTGIAKIFQFLFLVNFRNAANIWCVYPEEILVYYIHIKYQKIKNIVANYYLNTSNLIRQISGQAIFSGNNIRFYFKQNIDKLLKQTAVFSAPQYFGKILFNNIIQQQNIYFIIKKISSMRCITNILYNRFIELDNSFLLVFLLLLNVCSMVYYQYVTQQNYSIIKQFIQVVSQILMQKFLK
eukprot:TRINITY_DN2711_c0_g1_i6.p1 TRINITY_DN2711_c0_g1~~TRINITY_DN2711_c0_g1_i6.p1  ORF type:complete len:340 (-),score=-8.45 TRINITY_DN2711_c0_g1_i6:482-1417(-)